VVLVWPRAWSGLVAAVEAARSIPSGCGRGAGRDQALRAQQPWRRRHVAGSMRSIGTTRARCARSYSAYGFPPADSAQGGAAHTPAGEDPAPPSTLKPMAPSSSCSPTSRCA
jgi:hypothetical protein